eukprot:41225-Rhodomonas_salina.1
MILSQIGGVCPGNCENTCKLNRSFLLSEQAPDTRSMMQARQWLESSSSWDGKRREGQPVQGESSSVYSSSYIFLCNSAELSYHKEQAVQLGNHTHAQRNSIVFGNL